jgi:hypothetical protein
LTRPLPPETDAAIVEELRRRIGDFDSIVRELRAPTAKPTVRVSGRPSLQEARDASMTALRLFEADWRDLQPIPRQTPLPQEVSQLIVSATENDLIADDVDVFPGWTRHRSQGGWVEFHSRGRRLLVKNVNVSPVESANGADLIYWRKEPNAFVIVQYKKLTQTRGGLVYPIDDRLASQLQRMVASTTGDGPTDRPNTTDDYRLSSVSAFVKFAAPLERHADDELVPGYYLPADLVQLMLQNPHTGPRGGKILRIPDARSMNSEMFVRLVRDCWIGTTGPASTALHALLPGLREHPPAYLTFAYDEPWRAQS